MRLTRQEVNLRRLLAKCELLMKGGQKDEKKFPEYVASLEEMLKDVEQQSSTSKEDILDYLQRIRNLKIDLGMVSVDDLASGDKYGITNKMTPREELLEVRKRNPGKSEGGDLDEVLNYHQNMQEKIAEDMLVFTKNLKEQSTMANKIIKKDTEVVNRSMQLTDRNYLKLKGESEKITEYSKRAWKCWMWIMLLIVLVIFINMVFFMKVMKKKW